MVPRFYVDAALRAGGVCTLSEDAAHHAIRVLRLREGDEVTLFNGRGGEFAARIASIQRLRIAIDLLQHRAVERESPLRVALVQGVSSGERFFRLILETASGRKTKSEGFGYGEDEFAPWTLGATM